jgi:hypothetical protein
MSSATHELSINYSQLSIEYNGERISFCNEDVFIFSTKNPEDLRQLAAALTTMADFCEADAKP